MVDPAPSSPVGEFSQESGLLGPCRGVFPSYLAAGRAESRTESETAVNIVVTTPGEVFVLLPG